MVQAPDRTMSPLPSTRPSPAGGGELGKGPGADRGVGPTRRATALPQAGNARLHATTPRTCVALASDFAALELAESVPTRRARGRAATSRGSRRELDPDRAARRRRSGADRKSVV